MLGQKQYPRNLVMLLIMVAVSFSVISDADHRLGVGGYGEDVEYWRYPIEQILPTDSQVSFRTSAFSLAAEKEEAQDPIHEFASAVEEELDEALYGSDQELDEEKEVAPEEVRTESAEPEPELEEEKPKVLVHVVRSGETLWDISRMYGISMDTILAANDIANSNQIRVGQKLQILSVEGVLHPVAQGESLWEIARRYRVSLEAIIAANSIDNPGLINPGKKLIIPGATAVLVRDRLVVNNQLQKAFSWPLTGRISSPFGPRWGRMHNGIDIAVPIGTPIRASADGVVSFSGYNGGYGYLVIIDHGNGVETRYAHNNRNLVRVGQRVERGQLIAYSGNTGNSTGPHLHFEIRLHGRAHDPLPLLR